MSWKTSKPRILLVNPWIHDFAAYDYWAKPYGLLILAAILRERGFDVAYIDCLDRFHPLDRPTDPHARHGRGPYLKTPIPKPAGLSDVRRTYSRYGIPPQWLRGDLQAMPRPDMILVTSLMTYWYPGVFETIAVLKEFWPAVPLVLGGIYARLCSAHARRHSGADAVVTDRGESLLSVAAGAIGQADSILSGAATGLDMDALDALPYPAFDLQHRINYAPLLTTRGCPFHCAYCASGILEPAFRRRSVDSVAAEIEYWHAKYGVVDFAFYDDALLVDARAHALPLLEAIVRRGRPLHFHTPNALHIRHITAEAARLMHAAGFKTLRLGLETTAFEDRTDLDRKVTEEEFRQAVVHLKNAGFRSDQIGAYLLVGLPGQSPAAVQASIQVVKEAGITPVPAYYTPIEGTRLWGAAVAASRYNLEADPIFSNNAIFPCSPDDFSWQMISGLKELARG